MFLELTLRWQIGKANFAQQGGRFKVLTQVQRLHWHPAPASPLRLYFSSWPRERRQAKYLRRHRILRILPPDGAVCVVRHVLGRSKFCRAVHQTSAERLIMKRGDVLFPGVALPRTTGRRQVAFHCRPPRSGEWRRQATEPQEERRPWRDLKQRRWAADMYASLAPSLISLVTPPVRRYTHTHTHAHALTHTCV